MLEQAQQSNTALPADEHYSYDGVGNRLTDSADANGGTWQYNANHQLTARPDISYGYDANGHTVSKTAGAEVTSYEYDIAERMSAVKRDGVTLGSYQYDPFGRRVKKVTSAGAVYFHYDDTGLLAEYDASGQLISEYQYQPGNHWMTHPLFKRDGATGKVHYYYNSHLGQPLKLFDKAGRTTWSARSQAFGQTDVVVNETDNPLRFPGQYEDGETGLFYNWHRYYDAETGRYLQADPIGIEGGRNYYLYVNASPVSFIDPDGLILVLPLLITSVASAACTALQGGSAAEIALSALTGALPFGPVGSMAAGVIAGQMTIPAKSGAECRAIKAREDIVSSSFDEAGSALGEMKDKDKESQKRAAAARQKKYHLQTFFSSKANRLASRGAVKGGVLGCIGSTMAMGFF